MFNNNGSTPVGVNFITTYLGNSTYQLCIAASAAYRDSTIGSNSPILTNTQNGLQYAASTVLIKTSVGPVSPQLQNTLDQLLV